MPTQDPRRPLSDSGQGRHKSWKAKISYLILLSCTWTVVLSTWFGGYSCSAQAGRSSASAASATATVGGQTTAPTEQPVLVDPLIEACRLIYQGHFSAAADLARAAKASQGERAEQLERIIQQHEQIAQRRQADRAEAYAEQLKELDKLRAVVDLSKVDPPVKAREDADPDAESGSAEPNEPNDVTDVLVVLVKATEYANDQQKVALLADPFVQKVLQISADRSVILEAQGKWLEAYTGYFYWLSAIDPDNTGYSDHADELVDKASIAGSFQDSPCETRKERFEGVEKRMFERAMDALSLHYVNSIDYFEMATKAIDRCDQLAQVLMIAGVQDPNPGGSSPFPAPVPEKVTAWSVALAGLRDEIEVRTQSFGKDEFLGVLDKVLSLNDATVQLPRQPLIAHFAEASLKVLDPYTVMVWPRQVQDFEKMMMNEFSGIGIEISKPRGLLTVASLLPDTPAYRAGLDAGDVIEAVDGVPTKDMSLICAVKKITGPKGTSVVLAVKRPREEKAEEITITRDRIIVPTIRGWQRTEAGTWLYMVDEASRIGYVRITSFSSETSGDFETVLRELESQGLRGLIVDLRFNTGGLLDSAVNIVDKFIREGLIVRTQPKIGMIPSYEYAHRRGTHPDYPLVILINSDSASASEIVAGALADPKHERAVLVGDRTHGKGSVQGITHYPGGGAQLKYTMAYYHLPSGQRVKSRDAVEKEGAKDWGVGPDVEVKLNSSEQNKMLSAQRDNDVLVQAARDEHGGSYKKRTLAETLESDPQLAVALLVVQAKLIEADAPVMN
ncbi:MAG: S41 family peptidase [Sedimentisphaerales bacterium]|nr:S41 family peptidase [Sedimentisphaerales bacterium]NLZ06296.1 S41 family peptidase [Phycisphaerae bacterium]HNY79058.1 S41 family peptidase [Sedimentisphaerales bacterium]HOC64450.1 S41 family peptidase [Sedimentisphaerales bacterium]HOH65114.1 S41 family peptidase [Sedimentisphaerales bacterium]